MFYRILRDHDVDKFDFLPRVWTEMAMVPTLRELSRPFNRTHRLTGFSEVPQVELDLVSPRLQLLSLSRSLMILGMSVLDQV